MRFYRITFAAGLAAGYVAGTAAGRERYDQMMKFVKNIAEHPATQQAAGAIQAQATGLVGNAAQKVGGQLHDKVPQMAQSAMSTVGGHIPGVKHKNSNGHHNGNGHGNGSKGNDAGSSFGATSNSHLRPSGH
jgi:hypothetical protein